MQQFDPVRLTRVMTSRLFNLPLVPIEVGTPQQFRWLRGVVESVIVLNLLDAILTLLWVRLGMAEEANTLMRDLVNDQALAFVLAKIGLVSLGSILLWRNRHRALAVVAIFVSFLAYYFVFLYHLTFWSQLHL